MAKEDAGSIIVSWKRRVGPRVYAGEARVDLDMTPKEAFLWGVRAALASFHGQEIRRDRAARKARTSSLRAEIEARLLRGESVDRLAGVYSGKDRKARKEPWVGRYTIRNWQRQLRAAGRLPKRKRAPSAT